MNLNLTQNVTTIMTGRGNIRSYLTSIKNYRKSRVPMQTRHTNTRPSDISGQKAKERKINSEEQCTGLFISPSGISELDCATTKTDAAERSISIGRESLQVFFFVLGALVYFQVPPLWGSREEKWRSQ